MSNFKRISYLVLFALFSIEDDALCQKTNERSDATQSVDVIALAYIREGNFHGARIILDKTLQTEPSNSSLHELLGHAYVGLREFDRAIEEYTQAIKFGAHRSLIYNNRGGLYSLRKDWKHAIEDYSNAITIDPAIPENYYGRGIAYLNQHHYAKALADFDSSYKCGLGTVAAYSLAQLLATCPDPAVRDGRRALEYARLICESTNYKNPLFLNSLASALAETGQWEEAVNRTEQALSIAGQRDGESGISCIGTRMRLELYRLHEPYRNFPPEHPADWTAPSAFEALLYGCAKMDNRDYKGAVKDLLVSISIKPRLSSAHFALGCALNQLGRADDAIEHFSRCLELDPKNFDAYSGRAVAFCIVGKFREALSDSKKSLILNPKNFWARLIHAWAIGGIGETNLAIEELEQLSRERPDHDQIHFIRGECYLLQGQFDAAISEFTNAIQQNPQSAVAYASRAIALSALGRAKEAKQDLEACISLAPELRRLAESRMKVIGRKKRKRDS